MKFENSQIAEIVAIPISLLENWAKFNFTRLEDSTNFLSTRIRKLAQSHESSGIGLIRSDN